jgi:hypothetical protein
MSRSGCGAGTATRAPFATTLLPSFTDCQVGPA